MRMARRCPDWVAREDLVAAGMLGLIEAADRYDDSREEPFVSFAEHRIRGAILDELRRGDIMPRRARQLARKIAAATAELEQAGEQVTDERVANAIGVPVEAYRKDLAALPHVTVGPLEDAALPPSSEDGPDIRALQRTMLEQAQRALRQLAPRDVTVLGLYFLEELTYQQIADALGVTPSRVCQLLWRAIDRLRAQIGLPTGAAHREAA